MEEGAQKSILTSCFCSGLVHSDLRTCPSGITPALQTHRVLGTTKSHPQQHSGQNPHANQLSEHSQDIVKIPSPLRKKTDFKTKTVITTWLYTPANELRQTETPSHIWARADVLADSTGRLKSLTSSSS